jgi:hypothetical protein
VRLDRGRWPLPLLEQQLGEPLDNHRLGRLALSSMRRRASQEVASTILNKAAAGGRGTSQRSVEP